MRTRFVALAIRPGADVQHLAVSPVTTQDPPASQVDELTVSEVAAYLRVSQRTVYRWIHGGHLSAVRRGPRMIRVPRAALSSSERPQ